jgi:hypothetical protein
MDMETDNCCLRTFEYSGVQTNFRENWELKAVLPLENK